MEKPKKTTVTSSCWLEADICVLNGVKAQSLAVWWLRLHLSMHGVWIRPLIWGLRSHVPDGQKKNKTKPRNNIVVNSTKTLKTAHIKKSFKKEEEYQRFEALNSVCSSQALIVIIMGSALGQGLSRGQPASLFSWMTSQRSKQDVTRGNRVFRAISTEGRESGKKGRSAEGWAIDVLRGAETWSVRRSQPHYDGATGRGVSRAKVLKRGQNWYFQGRKRRYGQHVCHLQSALF